MNSIAIAVTTTNQKPNFKEALKKKYNTEDILIFESDEIEEDLFIDEQDIVKKYELVKRSRPSYFAELLMALKKELVFKGLFSKCEKSFTNVSLEFLLYKLDSVNYKDEFEELYEIMKNEALYKLGITGHSRKYFYNKKHFERLSLILTREWQDEWQKRMQADTNPLEIDIKAWERPDIEADENIKVSVIIPVYNCEAYIKKCLESVISQSLKETEIICVNDGSTDGSLHILEQFEKEDSRIIIVNRENGGLSVARNSGLENAKGEYVIYLDADDFLCDRALEYLYYEAKKENLDMLFYSAEIFYDDCDEENYKNTYARKANYDRIYNGHEIFAKFIENAEFKPMSCLYISKRQFIENNELKFLPGVIHEDNLYTIQSLYFAKKVRYANVKLYNKRVRKNSIMTDGESFRHAYNYYLIIVALEKFAKKEKLNKYPLFFEALKTHLERMTVGAGEYLSNVDSANMKESMESLDEQTAMDLYLRFSVLNNAKTAMKDNHETAKEASQNLIVERFHSNQKVIMANETKQKAINDCNEKIKKVNIKAQEIKKMKSNLLERLSENKGVEMPKVSIIIPTYNVEPYLVECMESITKQILEDIEIICINDGSTDNSLKILQHYASIDPRIILIDKENGGYGIGMNIGLEKATGEYIGILEPDDYVPVEMYYELYNIAKENDLDFVKADFYRFTRSEDDSMNLMYNHLSKNKEDYNKVFNPSETPEALRFIMNTWSGIYKREFLQEHNIKHNETPGASFQDNGFWFQTFVYAKRAMIVDKPYYRNRRDNPNSSVKNPQKVYCMNVEYDHIREILMKDEEIWNRFKYMYSLKKFHNYNATLKRISEEFKKEYIQRISEEFARAKVKGELCEDLFTKNEIEKLNLLISSPSGFYNTYAMAGASNAQLKEKLKTTKKELKTVKADLKKTKKELEKAKKQVKATRSSVTFRVGKLIMFVPYNLKKIVKKMKRKAKPGHVWYIGTPEFGNLGDHMISEVTLEILKDVYKKIPCTEISMNEYWEKKDQLQKQIKKNDIIIMHGGGNVGNLWPKSEYIRRDVFDIWKKNKKIIMPQSTFFTADDEGKQELEITKKMYNDKNLVLACRDKRSYDFAQKELPCESIFVPDTVVYHKMKQTNKTKKTQGALLCLRNDKEKIVTEKQKNELYQLLEKKYGKVEFVDTVIENKNRYTRKAALDDFFAKIKKADFVVTDRLHGMVFCALNGVPCAALDNNYGKISGGYEWISDLEYVHVAKNVEEVKEIINKTEKKKYKYNWKKYRKNFKPLIEKMR